MNTNTRRSTYEIYMEPNAYVDLKRMLPEMEYDGVKIGDLVLVTGAGWTDNVYLHVFRVNDIKICVDYEILIVIKFNEGNIRLRPDDFEVVEPQDTVASIGDTIIVTDPNLRYSFGRRWIVAESFSCPPKLNDISECVWCVEEDDGGGSAWFRHHSYEILKCMPDLSTSCPDCNGTGKIELFTSIVECECAKS